MEDKRYITDEDDAIIRKIALEFEAIEPRLDVSETIEELENRDILNKHRMGVMFILGFHIGIEQTLKHKAKVISTTLN